MMKLNRNLNESWEGAVAAMLFPMGSTSHSNVSAGSNPTVGGFTFLNS